jgi:hypothetical protein
MKILFITSAIMALTFCAFAQERLKAGGEIPPVGQESVPQEMMSPERLKEGDKDATLIPANACTLSTKVDPGAGMIYNWKKYSNKIPGNNYTKSKSV